MNPDSLDSKSVIPRLVQFAIFFFKFGISHVNLFLKNNFFLIYFWLCWVFVAAWTPVAVSWGYSRAAIFGLLTVVDSLVGQHGL